MKAKKVIPMKIVPMPPKMKALSCLKIIPMAIAIKINREPNIIPFLYLPFMIAFLLVFNFFFLLLLNLGELCV